MIGRLVDKLMSADFIGLVLLLTALQTLTSGIASSLRNTDTKYFFWVCCIAMLIALGLSKLKVNGIQASAGMIAIGLLGLWILGARLSNPLFDLGKAIAAVLPQIIPAMHAHIPIDTTPIGDAWLVIKDASNALSLRIQTWLFGLNESVTVSDPLVRSMAWILIIWLIAAWTGWFAGRRNAIASLLPSIILLAAITAYSGLRIYTLWILVSFLLLLMGIWNYKNHTTQWESRKIDYSDSIRYDASQAVLFLTIIIGAVMFITPSISWREIRDYLRERNQSSENEAANLLGIQQQSVSGPNVRHQNPSLPREHLLSGGYAQSEKIVMIIRTGELPPIGNPSMTADVPRHYWRSVTYDAYVEGGWVTSSAVPQNVQANTPLIPGLLNGYKTLHLDVKMVEPEGKLFWSGILFSADIPFKANWRIRPQSNLFADQSTLLQADMFAALSSATAYKAQSYIPNVTVEELRLASTEYPEEITKRYLELPDSLPARVRELAAEITQGQNTAYDKAKAIESYLRTYPYDLNVPAPPEDRDVADYFLFDLKRGYCDYYATAMVVLARASGIPARFVSGYSPGSYDAVSAQYIVRELNAHSWAEIYFPEIGWVEFEPTASEPVINLALTKDQNTPVQPSDSAATKLLNRFRLETALYWSAPLVVILCVLILYFAFIERWRYMRLAPATAIEQIYRRLYRLGRPLAGERTRAETASEFMEKLVIRIDRLREHSRFTKLLFSAQNDIELLTDMYQDTLFSHSNIQKQEAHTALRAWKRLRLRLWVARINAGLNASALSRRLRRIWSRPEATQTHGSM
ncbi:MAG TPA: transglutaminase-like domain-containing protein [Anaerolineales bacterium]|nr:transglutaminase-like domain-containing protein [Anaerolineales bacterium]